MSLAITFHVARLAARRDLNAASCDSPKILASSPSAAWRFTLFAPR